MGETQRELKNTGMFPQSLPTHTHGYTPAAWQQRCQELHTQPAIQNMFRVGQIYCFSCSLLQLDLSGLTMSLPPRLSDSEHFTLHKMSIQSWFACNQDTYTVQSSRNGPDVTQLGNPMIRKLCLNVDVWLLSFFLIYFIFRRGWKFHVNFSPNKCMGRSRNPTAN